MMAHPKLQLWQPFDSEELNIDFSGKGSYWRYNQVPKVNAKYGRGGDFNGTSSWGWIPDSSAIDILGAQTIAFWVKADRVDTMQTLVAKGAPYNWSFWIAMTASNELIVAFYGDLEGTIRIGRVTATGVLSVGEYAHIIVEYDGGTSSSGIKIFKNLEQVDITDYNARTFVSRENSSSNFYIGQDSGARYFDGIIDDVQVYNTVLPLSDKQRVYMGFHPISI